MSSKLLSSYVSIAFATLSVATGCSQKKEQGPSGKSYSFTATASTSIALKGNSFVEPPSSNLTSAGPTLCSSVICFTPTVLTG